MFVTRKLGPKGKVAVEFEVGEHLKHVRVDARSIESVVHGVVEPRAAFGAKHQGVDVVS